MNNERLSVLASAQGVKTLVVIDSRMGNPSAISFTPIQREHHVSTPLDLRIAGVRLRREFVGKSGVYRAKRLAVLKGEGSAQLEGFAKKLAGFLEAELIETIDYAKYRGEFGDRCVLLKAEKVLEEIILRFLDAKSSDELGPQIRVKIDDVSTNDAGGALVD